MNKHCSGNGSQVVKLQSANAMVAYRILSVTHDALQTEWDAMIRELQPVKSLEANYDDCLEFGHWKAFFKDLAKKTRNVLNTSLPDRFCRLQGKPISRSSCPISEKVLESRPFQWSKSMCNRLCSAANTLIGVRNAIAHISRDGVLLKHVKLALCEASVLLSRFGNLEELLSSARRSIHVLECASRESCLPSQSIHGGQSLCKSLSIQPRFHPLDCSRIKNIFIPPHPQSFIGREDIISVVLTHVSDQGSHTRFVFCGEPGIGKTALALVLAKRLRTQCPVQFILTATACTSLEDSLQHMRFVLQGPGDTETLSYSIDDTTLKCLSSCTGKHLLIVDDVQSVELMVRTFSHCPANILFTSVQNNVQQWKKAFPSINVHQVPKFSTVQSLQLIRERSKLMKRQGIDELAKSELWSWVELCLENLPLAVDLASRLLQTQDLVSVQIALSASCSTVTEEDGSGPVNRGLVSTIKLSLASLNEEELAMAALFSLFGRDIPLDEICACLSTFLQVTSTEKCRNAYNALGGNSYKISQWKLVTKGLVKENAEEGCFDMHHLVQKIVRKLLFEKVAPFLVTIGEGLAEMFQVLLSNNDAKPSGSFPKLRSKALALMCNFFHQSASIVSKRQHMLLAVACARGHYSQRGDVEESCVWYQVALFQLGLSTACNCRLKGEALVEHGALLRRRGVKEAEEGKRSIEKGMAILEEQDSSGEVSKQYFANAYKELAAASMECGESVEKLRQLLSRASDFEEEIQAKWTMHGEEDAPSISWMFRGPLGGSTNHHDCLQLEMTMFWSGVEKMTKGLLDQGFYEVIISLLLLKRKEIRADTLLPHFYVAICLSVLVGDTNDLLAHVIASSRGGKAIEDEKSLLSVFCSLVEEWMDSFLEQIWLEELGPHWTEVLGSTELYCVCIPYLESGNMGSRAANITNDY